MPFFGKRKLKDISSFLVEKYKSERGMSVTVRGNVRAKATVNRELQLLSRIFTLAMRNKEVRSNPCAEVEQFKGEVRRNRYLLPGEEERLMAELSGRRSHLQIIVSRRKYLQALAAGLQSGKGAEFQVPWPDALMYLSAEIICRAALKALEPVPVVIHCPKCGKQHIDEGEWATRPHKTHQCQYCKFEWRPQDYSTLGVAKRS